MALIYGIGIAVISLGALVAGRNYVRLAQRMRAYATTRGTVVKREIAIVTATREGRWGDGGPYGPKVTYTYTVDGVPYTSDRLRYAIRGLKRSVAERELAAVPDEVEVHYDPASPRDAYLELHTPRLGWWLIGGGLLGALVSLLILLP